MNSGTTLATAAANRTATLAAALLLFGATGGETRAVESK